MLPQRRRFWAEIDLNAAGDNVKAIRARLGHGVKLCCVVKANAYGHGAIPLADLYERLGVDYLAVSNIEEALQLRQHRIGLPILILGYTPTECAPLLAKHSLTQTVFSLDYAEELNACALAADVTLTVHIKLDTGMGRLGFSCRDTDTDSGLREAAAACRLPRLQTEGIFTHFAAADEGESGLAYTKRQLEAFSNALGRLEAEGLTFAIRHCANSAAALEVPEAQMDMVRAGLLLYGTHPSDQLSAPLSLAPVMSLKAVVSSAKSLRAGDSVSYGCRFTAERAMRVATVPLGYADGYRRSGSEGDAELLLRGRRVPVLGRICMDQLIVDVTDLPDVKRDEIVTVMGRDGTERITVDELAERNGTIAYEILCGVGERVPRFYLENGRVVAVKDILLSSVLRETEP